MSNVQEDRGLDDLGSWGTVIKDPVMEHLKRIGVRESSTETVDFDKWQKVNGPLKTRWALKLTMEGNDLQKLTVHSPYLIRILQTLKPSASTNAPPASMVIKRPFENFYGNWEKLSKLHDSTSPGDQTDFRALTYVYDEFIQQFHYEIEQRISENMVTFDDMWALFRSGTIICGHDSFSELQLFYTLDCQTSQQTRKTETSVSTIRCWHTTWNQSSKSFTRTGRKFLIDLFEGVRPITSFDVYPLASYTKWANNPITDVENVLEARGRKWRLHILSGYPCLKYSGPIQLVDPDYNKSSWREFESPSTIFFSPIMRPNPVDTYSGRVILDQTATSPFLNYHSPLFDQYNVDDESETASIVGLDVHGEYRSLDAVTSGQEFSRLQAMLCPSFLAAFVLDNKSWCILLVKNLVVPDWNTVAFEHLVLEERLKSRLKGLVVQHQKMKKMFSGDVIAKKGRGLVIVLHGAPGVGKTLTAEAIAEYTEKPLVQMDIDNPVDHNFSRFLELQLKLASRWDGVMLLDEADVILETRSLENLQRNSLVSTFLHTIEYYEGILVLTSNRLKTMDDAFKSRINIAVYFKQLNATTRKEIWLRFINRLPESEQHAKEELMDNIDDMVEWPLNGRQIRNVMTLAQSVAYIDHRMKGALRYIHVEDAANATIGFQDWFSTDMRESERQLVGISRNRRLREL